MAHAKKKPNAPKGDSRPDLPWVAITQLAIKAQGLATDHEAALGKRLTPTFLAAFAADIAALGVAVPASITARHGAVQLTAAQAAALKSGYGLVKGVRTAVKGQAPPKDVLLGWGIGTHINSALVKDVRSALVTIQNRITAEPAEAESFGITTEDLALIQASIAAIDKADQAQEAARATAPKTTRERNSTGRRLLSGIKMIAGAGMRVFTDDPTIYANFEALTKKTT